MVADASVAVTVITRWSVTTATASSAASLASATVVVISTVWAALATLTVVVTGSLATLKTLALSSSATSTSRASRCSRGLGGGSSRRLRSSVSLADTRYWLVDDLGRGVGRSVGVELRVIAQELVHVLGNNCRHLCGLKRLSRCSLLDAQYFGGKEARRELALWV